MNYSVLINLIHYGSQDLIWGFSFIFVRILGSMMILPLFSSSTFNHFFKGCLAFLFSLIVFPWLITSQQSISTDVVQNVYIIISNTVYGFILGYALSIPFWMIESCGSVIDMQRGEQMGSILNPITGNTSSSLGKLLTRTFLTYYAINGGILFYISFIYNSFAIIKYNTSITNISITMVTACIGIFTKFMILGISLILPIIFTLFIIDIILSTISAFIPQLNVTIFSMPIKSCTAIILLIFSINNMMHKFMYEIMNLVNIF